MSTGHVGEPTRGVAREAVVEELRALGMLALDRLDPLVGRLNESVSTERDDRREPHTEHRCTACPVCAAFADVRADHADALAQVARHAAGLLAALRVVLAQEGTGGATQAAPRPAREPDRVVQRIPVERVSSGDGVSSC
jgi:hypothetical protein